jgi:hypothetical protein
VPFCALIPRNENRCKYEITEEKQLFQKGNVYENCIKKTEAAKKPAIFAFGLIGVEK